MTGGQLIILSLFVYSVELYLFHLYTKPIQGDTGCFK